MKLKNLLAAVFLLSVSLLGYGEQKTNSEAISSEVLTVLTTTQIYPLALNWEQQFNNGHEGSLIKVSQLTNMADLNSAHLKNNLAIVSELELGQINHELQWQTVVGREIIVPVIHANHPLMEEIQQKGISKLNLKAVMDGSVVATWGNLLGSNSTEKVKILVEVEGNNLRIINGFLNSDAEMDNAEYASSNKEFMDLFEKENLSIGFCRLSSIIDGNTKELLSGLQILPFDFNGDGQLEKVENIYSNIASINRGVWIGKYPKELVCPIYAIASTKTLNTQQADFLKWLVTGGQIVVESAGMSALLPNEIPSKLSKIAPLIIENETPEASNLAKPYLVAIIGLIVLVLVFFEVVLHRSKRSRLVSAKATLQQLKAFNIQSVKIPKGIYFDRSHTWAFMEKDGSVRVGLDDFLQKVTGPFTRVILKDEGEKVTKGELLFTVVQEGKQLSVYAPVSGVIKSFNSELLVDASLINSSPYDAGWVYMIEPINWNREVEFLRVAEKYSEWLKAEFIRLKDFIAQAGVKKELEPSMLVLQDGGDIIEHVLYQMKPEVWEDFQTNFLDNTH